jgi:hypothetical protein
MNNMITFFCNNKRTYVDHGAKSVSNCEGYAGKLTDIVSTNIPVIKRVFVTTNGHQVCKAQGSSSYLHSSLIIFWILASVS